MFEWLMFEARSQRSPRGLGGHRERARNITQKLLHARGALSRLCGIAILTAPLCSCASEEKVVRYKPFLTGIDGASHADTPVMGDTRVTPADPTKAGDSIVRETPDGKVVLISKSPQHVMMHVERCLDEEQDQLLLEQVISEQTKDYYRTQGKDPLAYVQLLRDRRKDVAKLFSRMPQGEHSPSVMLRQLPDRVWRLDVVGGYAKGLNWTRLWVRMERGEWKLMWMD